MFESSIFPYGIRLKEGGALDIFPAAEITLNSKNGERLSLIFVIDSGATISALPKTDASVLGINLQEGDQFFVSGIEGTMLSGWRHELPVRLGKNFIKIPVVFLNSDSAPRVLGREGLFNKFTIVFEEAERRSGFLARAKSEAKKVEKILDGVAKRSS